jgi:hypothetical protein
MWQKAGMKRADGGETPISEEAWEELLARMAPPSIPIEVIEKMPTLRRNLSRLSGAKSALVIAGLCTDERYQSNVIRFDWLSRLLLSYGAGNRKARRDEFKHYLNTVLVEAGVNRLEDPPEENFIDIIPTSRGNFRIFTGYFEKASSFTESIVSAFEMLLDHPEKISALNRVYALLKLSEALVARAELDRTSQPKIAPSASILLPPEDRMRALSKRVHFSSGDLTALGIEVDDLRGFVLAEGLFAPNASMDSGNAPLDWYPLLKVEDGICVLSPQSISVAVRVDLIETATRFGVIKPLQLRLLLKQGADVSDSGFLEIDREKVIPLGGQPARDFVYEISSGRFVHVIQTVDSFDGWPDRAFGSTTSCPNDLLEAIKESVKSVRDHTRNQPEFTDGITLWLAGGWGAAQSVRLDFHEDNWPVAFLEPADAAVVGVCENGRLKDVWRLTKIDQKMQDAGYEFISANGLLNEFQWWRDTELSLIPPHMVDVLPPFIINYDTNLLLTAREEARLATDRASRLHPRLGWILTTRLDRQELSGPPKPIYVSASRVRALQLLGCATHEDGTWWVAVGATEEADLSTTFETWKATLEWASIVMSAAMPLLGVNWTTPLEFILKIETQADDIPRYLLDQIAVASSIEVELQGEIIRLTIKSDWHWALNSAENNAEVELAARILAGACMRFGIEPNLTDLRSLALKVAGSSDFRFRHALQAVRAIDSLRGLNLVGKTPYLSKSAAALMKCGSAWEVRPRSEGSIIRGKDECIKFLTDANYNLLEKLIMWVRNFDKRELVSACLRSMQGALAEMRNWENTASALRAIHGASQDIENSLQATSNANGVLRASAIIAEIAAAEGRPTGGRQVGGMDLEELQALALLVFLTGDMLPPIYADRINPTLKISPGGDVLYDHEFQERTIKETAVIRHTRERNAAVDEYRERFSSKRNPSSVEEEFDRAILAEFGVRHAVLRELSYGLVRIAERLNQGVFALRRRVLLDELSAITGFDFGPLVDRYTLKARPLWAEFPPGSTVADRDVSKFDRRYSLIGRPFLALDDAHDPELVLAPAVFERTLVHNISGAMTGTLQNGFWSSREMRSFASSSGSQAGIEFNDEVARDLKGMGMDAWPSALPSRWLNTKKTPEVVRLGDIDVLAISQNRKVVWIIEAKDLKLCRTLGETCRRLGEYRGVSDARGRPDALLRHLRRVSYMRTNADKLAAVLNISSVSKICGLIVVNSHQPMNQLRGEFRADAHVISLEDIAEIPWGDGWKYESGSGVDGPF